MLLSCYEVFCWPPKAFEQILEPFILRDSSDPSFRTTQSRPRPVLAISANPRALHFQQLVPLAGRDKLGTETRRHSINTSYSVSSRLVWRKWTPLKCSYIVGRHPAPRYRDSEKEVGALLCRERLHDVESCVY